MTLLSSPAIGSLLTQRFAYAYGRIGVLQQILLTVQDLDRLLGSSDHNEADRVLTELSLTNVIDQGLSEGPAILHALEEWLKEEVNQMAPESHQTVFAILWLMGDAPLLAYLLKEPRSGIAHYDRNALRALVEEGKSGTLPSHLVSFVKDIQEREGPSPKDIDTAVSRYVTHEQLALAHVSGSAYILRFVQHTIDLSNIRTALRLLDREEEPEDLLLGGGTIPTHELAGSLGDIRASIDRSPLAFALADHHLDLKTHPAKLERELADVLAADIAAMWNVPLSIEPLFAFASLTLSQLAVLRTLLIGKRNGLHPQEIKELLPPFLSASHYLL
jgi:vacuolar-type H+-ATPase subunit C/Vma6